MKEIGVEEIQTGIEAAEPQFGKLKALYGLLPETQCRCDRPGECCLFLPQMTWVEALQWFRCLAELPREDQDAMVRRFLEFFLSNPARRGHCPFLADDGGCGNYEFRPFACRAYGIWSIEWGRQGTAQSREGKKALVAMWQRYGIELPEETATHEMEYCGKVTVPGSAPPSDSRLMDLLSRVHGLDDAHPEMKGCFEDGYGSDFSALMASLVWGGLKANLNKYAVIKDLIQKKSDARLKKLLARATAPF